MYTTSNFAGRAFAALSALVFSVVAITGTVAGPGNVQTAHGQSAKVSAAYIGDVA